MPKASFRSKECFAVMRTAHEWPLDWELRGVGAMGLVFIAFIGKWVLFLGVTWAITLP